MNLDEMQQLVALAKARAEVDPSDLEPLDYPNEVPLQVCPREGLIDRASDAEFDPCWSFSKARRGRRFHVHDVICGRPGADNFLEHGEDWHHGVCPYCGAHVCDICRSKHRRCRQRNVLT
jgi:hypothetical protein